MQLAIRHKLFLAIMSVIVVFVAIVNYLVLGLLDDVIDQHIKESIVSSARAYDQFEAGRQDVFRLRAAAMSEVPHLKATLAIPELNFETIAYAGSTLLDIANLPLILVLDDRGQVLADVNQAGIERGVVIDQPGIEQVQEGYTHYDIWFLNGVAFRVAAAPVISGESLVGIVALGEPLGTPEDVRIVRDLASVDVAIVIQGEIVYPTGDAAYAKAVAEFTKSEQADTDRPTLPLAAGRTSQHSTTQGIFHSTSVPLAPSGVGSIIFYVSHEAAAGSLASVRSWVLIVSGFGLLFALWISLRLAYKISKPLRELTDAAQAFGQGRDRVEVRITSQDEVGTLARSFNSMTRDITQSREALIESKEAAEASSRAKSVFLATMSHEIRTPLNGVIGTAELLRRTDLTSKQQKFASAISSSSRALHEILNSILDFSKIESGQLKLEKARFNLNELVDDVVQLFNEPALDKHLNLVSDIYFPGQIWVVTDALRLRQVLTNLLSNAIKFTEQGEVAVSVRRIASETDNPVLRFVVSDTGIGISEQALDRVFEPFVQADDTMSRRFGGTGLGLSICRELVACLGGELCVDSTLEEGSSFWFDLELETTEINIQSEKVKGLDAVVETSYAGRFSGLLVLVVEDNVVNREIAVDCFRYLGASVVVAENGSEGVAQYKRSKPSIVFMDCQMPVLDGFAATDAIRRFESDTNHKRTPVVALTANAFAEDRQRCIDSGMDELVAKPFELKDLIEALLQWYEPDEIERDAMTVATQVGAEEVVDYPPQLDARALKALESIGRGASTLLQRIVDMYLAQTPKLIQDIEEALASENYDKLTQVAHSLKSSSANVGAAEIARYCAELEEAGKKGSVGGCSIDASFLLAAFHRVKAPLIAVRDRGGSSGEDKVNAKAEIAHLILVVDDDPAYRLTLAEVLRVAGFSVAEANGGVSALEEAERVRPDLMLIDAIMPGMDGFQTSRRFQDHPTLCDIPILMVTGLDDRSSIDHAFECGASGFLTKPIHYPLLAHQLRFVIRASETAANLREHQQRLSVANKMARLGYWLWDTQDQKLTLSEELLALCDVAPNQLKSLHDLAGLIHEDDRAAFLADVDRAVTERDAIDAEYRFCTSDGTLLHIHQHIDAAGLPTEPAVITATIQDVTKQKRTEAKVRWLAFYDSLTGLANRAYLHERLGEMIKSARRREKGFALFFMDLDGFKDVNDSLGHDQGDELLKIVAERLKVALRGNDFLARLGGDEFCMILEDTADEADIANIATRCLKTVEEAVELRDQSVKPQVSIGIAHYPGDGDDAHSLLRAADSAMYRAKESGKHRFEFFEESMTFQAASRLELSQSLRNALMQEEFELYYQPQISLRTGNIERYEALIRWNHPDRGLVPPNEFIPALERLGLINSVGDWVIHTACRQISYWQKAGIADVRVSVNIAPSHFEDISLPLVVENALKKFDLSAESLELEITESAIQNAGRSIDVLNALKGLGVRLAIDDFGAGYSSLGSLKFLPIDCLKIDRIFIRDLVGSPKDAVLLGTIMTLAHALDFSVVAEGVEELDQISILHDLGCDLVQGFYYSRPVPAESIPELHGNCYLPLSEPKSATA